MQCLKCGREIPSGQAFCEKCLQSVAAYPVRQGTAIHLPRKKEETAPRKPARKKRGLTPEELYLRQKRTSRRLAGMVAILLLICLALSALLLKDWFLPEDQPDNPGKDYTVSESN